MDLLDSTSSICKLPNGTNTWPCESLKSERFVQKSRKTSLFVIDLKLENSQALFSTKPELFEEKLIRLFDNAILATSAVPQLEKFVMEKLFWKGQNPLLESVGEKEPWVCEMREKLRKSIRTAMIPMKLYGVVSSESSPS